MAGYDAFISYSHAGDGQLAPRLQSGLERYARPWWKRRILRVFRDETGLSASPHLWSSIVEALDSAQWFIVLASPESAASEWVGREIEHWSTHRDPKQILVAVTDGSFAWDNNTGDIDWVNSTAAHPQLRGVFQSEPRYIDLTWARAEVNLDRRDGRFQDALAELAAPLRGIPKDELAGEDVRQHRRTMRLARGAALALAVLTALAVFAGVVAIGQRNQARDQRAEAVAQRAAADQQRTEAENQRIEADAQRGRADDQALLATARGTSSAAIAQTRVSVDRSLLLGAAAVGLSSSDETLSGLFAALESASSLVAFHHEVGNVSAFDVSPDGTRIVTLAPDGLIQMLGADDFSPILTTTLTVRNPYDIKFLGAGDVVGVISDEGALRIDATTLRLIGDPIVPTTLDENTIVVGGFSPDGTLVAVGQLGSPVVEVFDAATGQVKTALSLGNDCAGGVRGVDMNTPTARIAVTCITLTAMFDLNTGALIASRQSFNANGPLFSADGRILAVGYTENVVVVLDAATFTVIDQVDTPGTRVYSMDFSNDDQFLAVGSDSGEVAVYSFVPDYTTFDFATGHAQTWTAAVQAAAFGGIEGGVHMTAFDGTAGPGGVPPMLVGGPSGLSAWDQSSVPSIATERYRAAADVGWALLDAKKREVYRVSGGPSTAGTTDFDVVHFDGTVDRELHVSGDDVMLLDASPVTGDIAATGAVEWPDAPNATTLVAPSRFDLQILDQITGSVISSFDLTDAQPIEAPDSSTAQFANDPSSFPDGHYRPVVEGARFSPDGTRLVVQMGNSTSVWEVATGTLVASGSVPFGTAGSFGIDNSTIVNGTLLGQVEVYDAADLTLTTSIDISPGYSISNIEPMPASKQLLVTSESGSIYVVDPTTGRLVGEPFQASGIQLQQTAVDQAETTVAAMDRAGVLRMWRFDSRTPIGQPITVSAAIDFNGSDVQFSDGGVVIAEADRYAAFIPLATAALSSRACQLAGRQLTSDEWLKFVGDRAQVACR